MQGRLIVGNWKMNGRLETNASLLDALAGAAGTLAQSAQPAAELVVCVPFPYLAQARQHLAASAVGWGAQDISAHAQGAYTGEVSAAMVAEFGSRYAIVGHSERRQLHGESDALVATKAQRAVAAGLTPIVCVGETLAEREANATEAVVLRQLDAVLALLGADATRSVVAYEPVWAIGTGRTATPEQAQAVHRRLRERLGAAGAGDVKLLYGGSVKSGNAGALFGMADIDGALVGGASLEAGEFLAIARA